MSNKTNAVQAMSELFGDRDPSAVDRWMTPDYRQHSMAPDGPEGTRQVVASFHEGVRYEFIRAVADGDLVLLHGLYHGFGPVPFVAFDLVRLHDGKLAEHWDALTPLADTAGGPTQTDGPTEVSDLDATDANRAKILSFVSTVLQGSDSAAAGGYVDANRFVQHDPTAGDNITAAGLTYDTVHQVVAEGDFVLVVAEGTANGVPAGVWDLFRLEDGKIVEHWAVAAPIPAELPHNNGPF